MLCAKKTLRTLYSIEVTETMQTLLSLNNVSKLYALGNGNSQPALKQLSLDIRQGTFVSLMGASGSGKTTLLQQASGLDRPSAGSVSFDGEELSGLAEPDLAEIRIHKMGFIFQQYHLLKNLTLIDNIMLPAYMAAKQSRKRHRKLSRSDIHLRARQLMEQTGIAELADRNITQVSGGQLQRAGICRALINEPKIIIGDEPTGALHAAAADEIMDLLGRIHLKGTTILLATHDIKVAARTERVLLMADGKLVGDRMLGPYVPGRSDRREREARVTAWLMEAGL